MNAATEISLDHLELDWPIGSSVPKAGMSDFVQMLRLGVNMLTSMQLNQTGRVRHFPHPDGACPCVSLIQRSQASAAAGV